jgi:hypothetical protein
LQDADPLHHQQEEEHYYIGEDDKDEEIEGYCDTNGGSDWGEIPPFPFNIAGEFPRELPCSAALVPTKAGIGFKQDRISPEEDEESEGPDEGRDSGSGAPHDGQVRQETHGWADEEDWYTEARPPGQRSGVAHRKAMSRARKRWAKNPGSIPGGRSTGGLLDSDAAQLTLVAAIELCAGNRGLHEWAEALSAYRRAI